MSYGATKSSWEQNVGCAVAIFAAALVLGSMAAVTFGLWRWAVR